MLVTAEIPGTLKTPDGTNFEGAFEVSYGVRCTLLGAHPRSSFHSQSLTAWSMRQRTSRIIGRSGSERRQSVHFRLGRPALSPADNCRRESVATVYSRIPCLRTQQKQQTLPLSLCTSLSLVGDGDPLSSVIRSGSTLIVGSFLSFD